MFITCAPPSFPSYHYLTPSPRLSMASIVSSNQIKTAMFPIILFTMTMPRRILACPISKFIHLCYDKVISGGTSSIFKGPRNFRRYPRRCKYISLFTSFQKMYNTLGLRSARAQLYRKSKSRFDQLILLSFNTRQKVIMFILQMI